MRRILAAIACSAVLCPAGLEAGTDLIPKISVQQPTNWDSHVVARTVPGATVAGPFVTATSLSPTEPVWFNWSVHTNASIGGSWTDQLLLDGVPIQVLPRWTGPLSPRDWYALDAGPVFVPGGRHTVTALTDATGVLESGSDRTDNRWDRPLIWTPEPLPAAGAAPGQYASRVPAPVSFVRPGLPPNNHAFSLARPTEAWVVAMRPLVNIDLVLYDDYTNSLQGLTHEVARSARTLDSLELVVGGTASVPATFYPALERDPAAGEGTYLLNWGDTAGRVDTDGDAFWDAESLRASDFANLYAIDLQAGQSYPISLWRRVGLEPIHFAVLPGDPSFVGTLDDALVRSQPVAGQDYEVATFSPSQTGRYLIVAFRENNEYPIARYQLAVGSAAVGVGPQATDGVWLEASPNPSHAPARLRYTLSVAAHTRLEVLDVQGRRLRTVLDGGQPAGTHDIVWDLKDDAGVAVAPGLYWARLDVAGRERRVRLAVVR